MTPLKRYDNVQPFNKIWLYGNKKPAITLTRMKLGLSGLHSQLYNYSIIAFKNCAFCANSTEDCTHYLRHCPRYAAQRSRMLANLSKISCTGVNLSSYIDIFPKYVTSVLLFGSPDVDINTNEEIFETEIDFIRESNRL